MVGQSKNQENKALATMTWSQVPGGWDDVEETLNRCTDIKGQGRELIHCEKVCHFDGMTYKKRRFVFDFLVSLWLVKASKRRAQNSSNFRSPSSWYKPTQDSPGAWA
jgi:hypothetical protein